MQRAGNPLPDRLAFFWHRHWAISRDDGSVSDDWALAYRNRLLKYSDFAANPTLTFRQMAYEITTARRGDVGVPEPQRQHQEQPERELRARADGAVLPRPDAPDGTPNYTQTDIEGLTRALTGWRLNGTDVLPDGVTPNPDYGKITFAPGQFYMPPRRFLGGTIPAVTGPTSPVTADELGVGAGERQRGDRHRARARAARPVPDPQAVGGVHRQPDPAGDARLAHQRLHGRAEVPAAARDPRDPQRTR